MADWSAHSGYNVANLVASEALTRPDAPALRFESRSWTYAELDEEAARAANAFRALGVRAGDRIAILLPNIPAFVIAYLGTLRLGAIVVSVSTAWPASDAARAIADAAPRIVVLTTELHERLAIEDAAPDSARRIVVRDGTQQMPSDVEDWEILLNRAVSRSPIQPVTEDAAAAILYTSGTSGEPKGVALSHRNVRSTAAAKVRYCGFHPLDGVALVLPLFHCYGQNAVLAATFAAGGCVVLQRRFDAAAIVRGAQAGEITALPGVPLVFRRLLDLDDRAVTRAMRTLRYVFSAATTLPGQLAESWRERMGHTIYEGYGLTESSPFAAYNHHQLYVPGALGTPIEGVEMAIADVESERLLKGSEVGEIVIRGPNVMLGYWRRPTETAQALRGGWLHTGDLGVRDKDGYYHLQDRMHDLVKVAGYRVFPSSVELVLQSHPAVCESVAFGVSDPVHGELLEAAVVCAPGRRASEHELLAHCQSRLARYQVPARIHLRDELPRNTTGKVLRRELRDSRTSITTPRSPLPVQH